MKFDFERRVQEARLDLRPLTLETLQINITRLCNQACHHCHVDASPKRREFMSDAVIDRCLDVLARTEGMTILDITGGAPELHPGFRRLVTTARGLGKRVMVRHNLTVTLDPHPITRESMHDLPDFFAENRVEIVSSLPYYKEYFTDRQRGSGVFRKSVESLKLLNARGFGRAGSGLTIHLVYNPVGAFLPAPQGDLEREYKRELKQRFDVDFNQLFVITNMPIHRFKRQLERNGGYEEYMEKLMAAFNPQAALGVMCRNLISVDHEGYLYDCDFNQMLGLQIQTPKSATHITAWEPADLLERKIVFGPHCLGCTAGAGSSCGGNTVT